MSLALAEVFREHGGDLRLSSEVTEILVEGKAAVGVRYRTRQGTEKIIRAKWVISDGDLTTMVTRLVPPAAMPAKFRAKVQARVPSHSTVMVFLGLDIDVRDHGITDYELWRLRPSQRTPARFAEIYESLNFENLPIEMITVYSNLDTTCCPAGKSVVSMIFLAEQEAFQALCDPDGTRGERYQAAKTHIADQFITIMADALGIPDLAAHVEVAEVMTPLTLIRYTGNRRGAHLGWAMTAKQMMMDPIFGKTPLKRLALTGHWTMPGGGVSSTILSGYMAAQGIKKSLKLR
jgi:prolycopene isomerase